MLTKIHADLSVSISELKRNPQAIIDDAKGKAIALLNHNKPTAYIVPAETYERLMEMAALTAPEAGASSTARAGDAAEAPPTAGDLP